MEHDDVVVVKVEPAEAVTEPEEVQCDWTEVPRRKRKGKPRRRGGQSSALGSRVSDSGLAGSASQSVATTSGTTVPGGTQSVARQPAGEHQGRSRETGASRGRRRRREQSSTARPAQRRRADSVSAPVASQGDASSQTIPGRGGRKSSPATGNQGNRGGRKSGPAMSSMGSRGGHQSGPATVTKGNRGGRQSGPAMSMGGSGGGCSAVCSTCQSCGDAWPRLATVPVRGRFLQGRGNNRGASSAREMSRGRGGVKSRLATGTVEGRGGAQSRPATATVGGRGGAQARPATATNRGRGGAQSRPATATNRGRGGAQSRPATTTSGGRGGSRPSPVTPGSGNPLPGPASVLAGMNTGRGSCISSSTTTPPVGASAVVRQVTFAEVTAGVRRGDPSAGSATRASVAEVARPAEPTVKPRAVRGLRCPVPGCVQALGQRHAFECHLPGVFQTHLF